MYETVPSHSQTGQFRTVSNNYRTPLTQKCDVHRGCKGPPRCTRGRVFRPVAGTRSPVGPLALKTWFKFRNLGFSRILGIPDSSSNSGGEDRLHDIVTCFFLRFSKAPIVGSRTVYHTPEGSAAVVCRGLPHEPPIMALCSPQALI